ncbi:hypothetical protein A2U01_0115023, partial [Trifolium medium]|nr:hypothetical protein [Trifolium medium]
VVWRSFCQLRAAQARMARRARQLDSCIRRFVQVARRASASGASRTFIVRHARRAE